MRNKRARKREMEREEEDLVKTEIDAAEALAEFSKQCFPDAMGKLGDSLGHSDFYELKWLKKGKRSRPCQMECSSTNIHMVVSNNSAVDFPLVKDEYPSDDSDKGGSSTMPLVAYNRFDTSEDSLEPVFRAESPSSPLPPIGNENYSAFVKKEEHSTLDFKWNSKAMKLELSSKPRRASSAAKGRTGRTALTDEEIQMRKIRRIEANRESARQTIRKKQKMCEEMTTKANELTSENERMRKELEEIREQTRRMYETRDSLRDQAGTHKNARLYRLAELSSSGSEDSPLEPDQSTSSTLKPYPEPIIQQVQINRQDDNILEFTLTSPTKTTKITTKKASTKTPSTKATTVTTKATTVTTTKATTVTTTTYTNSTRNIQFPIGQFKVINTGLAPANYFNYYHGRKDAIAAATAAQARRHRRELQLTRNKNMLSRQVSRNL